jgi:hypothetical protein
MGPIFSKRKPLCTIHNPTPPKLLSPMMPNFTPKKSKICDHHDAWVELQAPNCLEAMELALKSSGYETQQNHLWQYAFESCSYERVQIQNWQINSGSSSC